MLPALVVKPEYLCNPALCLLRGIPWKYATTSILPLSWTFCNMLLEGGKALYRKGAPSIVAGHVLLFKVFQGNKVCMENPGKTVVTNGKLWIQGTKGEAITD